MRLAHAGLVVLTLFAPVEAADQAVQRLVQGVRRPALEGVMHGATSIGKRDVVLGVLLGIAVFDPAGPATARLAVLALAATNLVVEGTKRAVGRTRPDGDRNPANASFPSSHAANAVALAWVLARRWRRLAPLFWSLAGVIAFSRMYLNRHYLSDVVVGIAIGLACTAAVLRWWASRRPRPAPAG